MSVLNLGLQCVGLARDLMPDDFEKEVGKCNNLTELRKIASHKSGIKLAVQDSLSPVKVLLCSIFNQLKLHDNDIRSFASASPDELHDFWSAVIAVESTLQEGGRYCKDNLDQHSSIAEFISHCCQSTQYTFNILKCGKVTCTLCKPVKLPADVFQKLHHIPHPVLGEDNHYKPFSEVFGSETIEECPSFKSNNKGKNSLPFYGRLQHVENANLVIQCSECDMWRLVFLKYKLKPEQRRDLQSLLDDFTYT